MTLLADLEQQIKEALKARDQIRLGTVRLIKACVKNKEIELRRCVSDAEYYALLSTMAKQRRESIEQFTKGGREDLVSKEEGELQIIESFLPQELSDEELNSLIREAIVRVQATNPKDMGLVMKDLKDKTAGRIEGKKLADSVKKHLEGLA